jgi:acetoin utilization deacetylase AcuC-like enzyme
VLPFKLVYHPGYNLNLGAHVFPAQKYRFIRDGLVAKGIADPADILAPQPAGDEDVLRVHTAEYVNKLKMGTLTASEIMRLELPYSPQIVEAFWLAAGGSILAAHCALQDGFGVNLGGGFHHAFPGHGEGFCMLHDVAIAIRRVQHDKAVSRVLVVDTDVHQGNGTAAIFAADPSVFTLSIHQERNYPAPKPPSDIDVNLEDGVADEEYLRELSRALAESFAEFSPELLFYLAGADPYREDQLGGLQLTLAGLRQRDELVFTEGRRRGVPVAITLAGGYARNTEDTVRIHMNTVLAARDCCDQIPRKSSAG